MAFVVIRSLPQNKISETPCSTLHALRMMQGAVRNARDALLSLQNNPHAQLNTNDPNCRIKWVP